MRYGDTHIVKFELSFVLKSSHHFDLASRLPYTCLLGESRRVGMYYKSVGTCTLFWWQSFSLVELSAHLSALVCTVLGGVLASVLVPILWRAAPLFGLLTRESLACSCMPARALIQHCLVVFFSSNCHDNTYICSNPWLYIDYRHCIFSAILLLFFIHVS